VVHRLLDGGGREDRVEVGSQGAQGRQVAGRQLPGRSSSPVARRMCWRAAVPVSRPGGSASTQCTGFAGDVRAWLLVLPGGDARTRPRSHTSIYVYFGSVRPILEGWTATRAHLREITAADATAALDPLRG
jgi:hypothetical protein